MKQKNGLFTCKPLSPLSTFLSIHSKTNFWGQVVPQLKNSLLVHKTSTPRIPGVPTNGHTRCLKILIRLGQTYAFFHLLKTPLSHVEFCHPLSSKTNLSHIFTMIYDILCFGHKSSRFYFGNHLKDSIPKKDNCPHLYTSGSLPSLETSFAANSPPFICPTPNHHQKFALIKAQSKPSYHRSNCTIYLVSTTIAPLISSAQTNTYSYQLHLIR